MRLPPIPPCQPLCQLPPSRSRRPFFDNGQTDEGRAFAFHGSAAGLSGAWTAEGDQASAGFAQSVAGAGDVDANGYADVIVGAPTFDGGQTNEGRALLYAGRW